MKTISKKEANNLIEQTFEELFAFRNNKSAEYFFTIPGGANFYNETEQLSKVIITKEYKIILNSLEISEFEKYFKLLATLSTAYNLNVKKRYEKISLIIEESSIEIMDQIKLLQKEMELYMDSGNITQSQFNIFYQLCKNYNNAIIQEGNLSIKDYVENGRITCAFEERQDVVGNYQVNFHSGVDAVGGNLKSPFFMNAVGGNEKGSNAKVFEIIGTNYKMRVLHGDSNSMSKTGDFFKPKDMIMPFPRNNNFNLASTAPHFHIELSNGENFVNPFTLKVSEKKFQYTINGGESWKKQNCIY